MVALKIFFRFLAAKNEVDRDPAETLGLPRIERYLPETLNELQVEHLIENIDTKGPFGLRDRAMLELLYASGLRISELANARLENFDAEERILRVTGKGNKTRLVPVGRKASEALAAYLSMERPKLIKRHSGSEIFLSERGNETDDRTDMANREKDWATLRTGKKYLSAFVAAQFCHAFVRQWRRPAHHPGNARPRGHIHHASLHPCRSTAAQGRASAISSEGVGKEG